jgi:hypothetical protein
MNGREYLLPITQLQRCSSSTEDLSFLALRDRMANEDGKMLRCDDTSQILKYSRSLETFAVLVRGGFSYRRQCSTGGIKIQARIPFNC